MGKLRSKAGRARRTRGSLSANSINVAIVVSRYNETITRAMLSGALAVFSDRLSQRARTGDKCSCEVFDAPGSFELVALAHAAAAGAKFDGVVALGCIIKGETSHDQHLGAAVTSGLAQVSLLTGVPVGLGVLTVQTMEQAQARAGIGDESLGNKGGEAMDALLDTIAQIRRIQCGNHAGLASSSAPTRRNTLLSDRPKKLNSRPDLVPERISARPDKVRSVKSRPDSPHS